MDEKDTASRKWQLTFNNPEEHGSALVFHCSEKALRPCLKNGKTPSLGIFFRQDCVDWT